MSSGTLDFRGSFDVRKTGSPNSITQLKFYFTDKKTGPKIIRPRMYFCCRFSFARSSGHVVEGRTFLFFSCPMRLAHGPTLKRRQTLISTSTPLGSSSFISASMVLDEEL